MSRKGTVSDASADRAAAMVQQRKNVSADAKARLLAAIDGMEKRHIVETAADICRQAGVDDSTYYRALVIDDYGGSRRVKDLYAEARQRIEDRNNKKRSTPAPGDLARTRVDLANAAETVKRQQRRIYQLEKRVRELLGAEAVRSSLDPDVTERLRQYDDLYALQVETAEDLERTRREVRTKEAEVVQVRQMMQDYLRENAALQRRISDLDKMMRQGRAR